MIQIVSVRLVQGDLASDHTYEIKLDLDGREATHFRVVRPETPASSPSVATRIDPAPRSLFTELERCLVRDGRFLATEVQSLVDRITDVVIACADGRPFELPSVIWRSPPAAQGSP